MGATQGMKVVGADDAQNKGAGRWRGMGFGSYADTHLSGGMGISRLAAIAALSAIEGDPGDPAYIAFAESIRKRMRPSPP